MRRSDYSVHGIDVSHYQKYIDWQAVADQNIHFAFIKATEGETFRDSLFCSNWEKIKDAGIRRGAYHFFRPTVPAEAQARNFIEGIELGHGDLAPVLDVEVMDGVSETDMRESVKKWLNLVESTYKIKPILYTNQKFFNRYLAGHFQDYPVWIARYHSRCKPELKASHEWQFWQYGNRGRLKGINGDVDFNVFYGSLSDLEHFCLNRPAPLLDSSKIDVASSNP
jgi:lysozyme